MKTNAFIKKLKRDVIPGINLFEGVLFTITSTLGIILFILSLTIWSGNAGADWKTNTANLLTLLDIPIGILAATFIAKRHRLGALLLAIDAFLYGTANLLAGQFALAFVNDLVIPFLYLFAFFYLWPKWAKTKESTGEIYTHKMNLKSSLLIVGGVLLFSIAFGIFMPMITNSYSTSKGTIDTINVWFGSFAAALMLIATIMVVMRYRENWFLYFISNTVKIILFSTIIITGYDGYQGYYLLLLLAIAYWINSLFGMFVWSEDNNE